MPNFGIKVTSTTSTTTLDVLQNTTGYPLLLQPTTANACETIYIYYNGVQI
jgi:hypothetical protein